MKPILQTRFGGPGSAPEDAGNCYAACVATIFELSLRDVPDATPEQAEEDGWDAVWGKWFAARGLTTYCLAPGFPEQRYPGYSIGSVPSRRGPWDHAVVCHDGKVVWDPNPENAKRPVRDDEVTYWEVFAVLDPASPKTFVGKFSAMAEEDG